MSERSTYEELEQRVQELEESVRQYAYMNDLVGVIPRAVFLIDLAGRILFANAAGAKRLGIPPDSLLGMNLSEFFPPDVAEKRRQKGMEALRTGKPQVLEDRIGEQWYHSTLFPVDGGNGNYKGLAVYSEDMTDRKKAELALKQREANYTFLAENMMDMVWMTDRNFRTTFVSPSIQKVLGFTPEERHQQPLERSVTPDSLRNIQERFLEELKRDQEEGVDLNRSIILEVEYYRKDGSTVWMENHVQPIRDSENNITGIMGVSRDISERKKAEAALKESEITYRELFENATFGIGIANEQGKIIDYNEAMLKPGGYDRDDISKLNNLTDLYYRTEDRQRIIDIAKKQGFMDEVEVQFKRKDGTPYDTLLSLRPMNVNGKLHWQAFIQDITERRRAETALRMSEEKYRFLAENSADIIYKLDITSEQCTYASPSVENLFGYTVKEFISLKAQDMMTPESYAKQRDTMIKALEKQEESAEILELEAVHKDGRTIPVEINASFIFDEQKNPVEVLGIARDITERKRLEENLLQCRKMEAIGTLTGGIAHDYNNLMSVIMGNLSLAQEEAEPGSALAYCLKEADIASRKVRDLTHELMSLSRGGGPVREVRALDEVLRNVSVLIPADSGISLTESISQDLKLVPYDRHKMMIAIRNLVKNAVEAMPDGGKLKIKAENLRVEDGKQDSSLILKTGDYVHISIQDQGKGIPEEDMDKIFDPYFSSKARGAQRGMGLGLTTAYAIIQLHGGHIQVDSSPAGTTVKIYLPAENRPTGADSTSPKKDNSVFPMKRLLVMDDEEMLRALARKMLNQLGYETQAVKDGHEAIELYKQGLDSGKPFDAVILDLTIKGGMGGKQTIQELLKINPDVKAIVSSGYFNDPVMADFEKYGFMGTLAKPYEKKALKEALERLSE